MVGKAEFVAFLESWKSSVHMRQTPRAVIRDPCQPQSPCISPEDGSLHWCPRGAGGDALVSSLQGLCGHRSLQPAGAAAEGWGGAGAAPGAAGREGASANSLSSNRRPLTTSITLVLKHQSNAEAQLCWQLQICDQWSWEPAAASFSMCLSSRISVVPLTEHWACL